MEPLAYLHLALHYEENVEAFAPVTLDREAATLSARLAAKALFQQLFASLCRLFAKFAKSSPPSLDGEWVWSATQYVERSEGITIDLEPQYLDTDLSFVDTNMGL